jgi:hypothetical protein
MRDVLLSRMHSSLSLSNSPFLHSLSFLPHFLSSSLPFLSSFPHTLYSTKIVTLSPQKVIVFSVSSIPPTATHVVLICYDPQLIIMSLSLPSTLTNLTLKSFHKTVTYAEFNQIVKELPPTLTHLTTGSMFNQPTSQLGIHSINQLINFHHTPPSQLDMISTKQLINFQLHTHHFFNQPVDELPLTLLISQLDIFSTKQLINFHQHSLISQLGLFLPIS